MLSDLRGGLDVLGRLSRRSLLGSSAVAALARKLHAQDLVTDTSAVVDAVVARILPSDDGPGAKEAKVARFIERQMIAMPAVRSGLEQVARLLDLWARKSFAKPFAALGPAEQDAILGQLARGQIPARGFPQEATFRALHTLTLEGFLSDPIHGGNDSGIGWRAIGFPTPHLRRPGAHHGR